MSDWRYIAVRLDGAGGSTVVHPDLPLNDVSITQALSGPSALSATIQPVHLALQGDDGRPVFREWSTAIWAEKDGIIRGGGILERMAVSDARLSLECVGFTGYLRDLPYTEDRFFVEADPMDIARHIWDHVQSQPAGNLGVTYDFTKSPVRIGTELRQVEFDTQEGPVSFEAGPYKLAWWQTDNLQSNFDGLAKDTPFAYLERPSWAADSQSVRMHIQMGYPSIGARRTDLRFVVGENVTPIPDLDYEGEDYASHVIVLGAGEGRTMVRGDVSQSTGRLRRVAVVQDKSIKSKRAAVAAARAELALRSGEFSIADISVREHSHAPIGSWDVGDEIFVQGDAGWQDIGVWCRVVGTTISPDNPEVAALTILRTDKVAS